MRSNITRNNGREVMAPVSYHITQWHIGATAWGAVVSRAIDTLGNIQPTMDDPRIAKKHTRWESNGQFTRRIRIT